MNDPLLLHLPDLSGTRRLGMALAQALMHVMPGALLLYGDLGVGKTTLTRSLVESLPGGRNAEVSSPSFTICNIYSTQPPVYHFDLYRLEPGSFDESLEESLDDQARLTIIEWPDNLALRDMPADGVSCRLFAANEEERRVELFALGVAGESYLGLIRALCRGMTSA